MAATQGRSSSTTKAANGGGISLETKKLVPVLAVLSRFPFFYIIWMSLNIVPLINGISLDSAGLAIWTRMFTYEIISAAWARAALYFVALAVRRYLVRGLTLGAVTGE
jgi:hypothetical protein